MYNFVMMIFLLVVHYTKTDLYLFRHKDKLTLKMRYARTNVLKCSYFHEFHRVVGTGNSLPPSLHEATSVNSFNASAKKFFYGLVSIFF